MPLIRITAPHFTADLVAEGGEVIEATPDIGYMLRWNGAQVARYCRSKGWTWERVCSEEIAMAEATAQDTNTAFSIEPLANDIVALCQTAAYDDMSWAEIDRALVLASHQVKVIFAEKGTLDPSP